MKIEINKLTPEKIEIGYLERIAKDVLGLVKLDINELSIVLVDGRRMRALNKKYKKKDRITDVLAFDYGEIIICLPQARRQAKEFGFSTEQELATLLIHGILHLSGYDDRTKKEKEKMIKKQDKVLKEVYEKN